LIAELRRTWGIFCDRHPSIYGVMKGVVMKGVDENEKRQPLGLPFSVLA
jgi:hypothetical protein